MKAEKDYFFSIFSREIQISSKFYKKKFAFYQTFTGKVLSFSASLKVSLNFQ